MSPDAHTPRLKVCEAYPHLVQTEDNGTFCSAMPGVADGLDGKTHSMGSRSASERARLIVRAVNSHAALVEALKPFAKFACDPLDSCTSHGDSKCFNCAARDALTLAAQSDQ